MKKMTKEEFYKTVSGNVKDDSYFCININCSECPFSDFNNCLKQSIDELFEMFNKASTGLTTHGILRDFGVINDDKRRFL